MRFLDLLETFYIKKKFSLGAMMNKNVYMHVYAGRSQARDNTHIKAYRILNASAKIHLTFHVEMFTGTCKDIAYNLIQPSIEI